MEEKSFINKLISKRSPLIALFFIGLISFSFIISSLIFKQFFISKNQFLFNLLFYFCMCSLIISVVVFIIHAFTDLLIFTKKNNEEELVKLKELMSLDRAFKVAKRSLKKYRGSYINSYLYNYALPWYFVAGDEGAGKTSFILNSGIDLPRNSQNERYIPIQEGGSIILCDKVVFVDLPSGFMKDIKSYLGDHLNFLLRRFRPAQPLNGIIYIIDLNKFYSASHEQINNISRDLRSFINRFQDQLGVTPPVYVIFSHLDSIEGFSDFFDGTPTAPRNQVFGITLPTVQNVEETVGNKISVELGNKFDEFLAWQLPRTHERITSEIILGSRYRTFFFPLHLASLKPRLIDFFENLSRNSDVEEDVFIRGLYFVNSTRLNDKIDEKSEIKPILNNKPNVDYLGDNHGYFIKDIINSVILEEADLVGQNEKETARNRRLKTFSILACGLLAFILLIWLTISFTNNNLFINRLTSRLNQSSTEFSKFYTIQQSKFEVSEINSLLPVLHGLENLPGGWNDSTYQIPLSERAGLSQRNILSEKTRNLYLIALQKLLRPMLSLEIERNLSDSATDQQKLYDNLAAYLMINGHHSLDKKFVYEFFTVEYQKEFPGSNFSESRAAFSHHLVNLLGLEFDEKPLRADLVESTRQKLSNYSPAIRTFSLLINDPQIKRLDPWRINDSLGPLGSIAINRRSGASIYESIPGLYTADNFKSYVVPTIQKLSRQVIDEDWIIFSKSSHEKKRFTAEELTGEVLLLFSSKYVEVWDNLLNDITISKFTDFNKEMVILQAISGPSSPLESILQSISRETTLSEYPPGGEKIDKLDADLQKDNHTSPVINENKVRKIITLHFSRLHDFVKGSPSLLGETLRLTNQIRALIAPVAAANSLSAGENNKISLNTPISDNLQSLQRIAYSAPSSVGNTIDYIVRQTKLMLEAINKTDIESAWRDQIFSFCRKAINDRYPFALSDKEVTLSDFVQMFAPNGIMDQFFHRNVEAFVDTSSTSGWKNLITEEIKFPLSLEALDMFHRADIIKKVFFPSDAKDPRLSFTLELTDLDIKAKGFLLDFGGQSISYQYGISQSVPMVWPMGNNAITVKFTNVKLGEPSSFSIEGPWALFRLIQKHRLMRKSATQFILNIDFSDRYSSLLLTASTIVNPFQKNILRGFRCLPSLIR